MKASVGSREKASGWPVGQKYSNYSPVTSVDSTTDLPDLSALVRLTHHRWVIPLVAAIGPGGRFAVLQGQLGVARQTLRRALDAADALGLVLRNPGYGHPLRPEYLLSPRGEEIHGSCRRIVRQARRLDRPDLVGRKWVLPVLAALSGDGPLHFAELEARVAPVSPAALTRTLHELVQAGWVGREAIGTGHAPYRLEPPARALARAAAGLAG